MPSAQSFRMYSKLTIISCSLSWRSLRNSHIDQWGAAEHSLNPFTLCHSIQIPNSPPTLSFLLSFFPLLQSKRNTFLISLTLHRIQMPLLAGHTMRYLDRETILKGCNSDTIHPSMDVNALKLKFNSIQFYLYNAFYNTRLSQSSFIRALA